MKRIFQILLFVGVVLFLFVSVGNWYLRSLTDRALTYAPALGRELGVAIENIDVELVKVSGIRSVGWHGISAKTKVVSASTVSRPGAKYFLTADYIGATLLSPGRLLVEADGVRLDPLDDNDESTSVREVKLPEEAVHGRISVTSLQFVVELESLFSPDEELKKIIAELSRLHTLGKTNLGMTLQGKLEFMLGDRSRSAKLVTDVEDEEWVFRVDESDLRVVSFHFDDPLADGEIELMVNYPFRLAELLQIRDEVRKQAIAAYEEDKLYPVQAYRHVLWSFLLSKKFGVDFARKATEAFQGSSKDSKAQAAMNYSNQRVGRAWAEQSILESDVKLKTVESEEVIRMVVEEGS